jgi:hypothetical protein
MKAYGGNEVYLHAFLTLVPDGGEWSALPPPIPPRERAPSPWYILDRRLVNPRVGLDMVVKRKNPCPCQESNPSSSPQPGHYTN